MFSGNLFVYSQLVVKYIFCVAMNFPGLGHPLPKVTWWRDGVELNHLTDHEGLSAMVNHLTISTVTRDLYGTKLECRAQGSELIEPVTKEVTVQVHRKCLITNEYMN